MANFSAAERRNQSIKLLQAQGHVSVTDLSETFGVSEVTIRKDLQYLEERNLLLRTHGGAMLNDYLVNDQTLEEKTKKYSLEKQRIGAAAATLVDDGDTILMDAGTTMIQVARHLRGKRGLTILTSSISVAVELTRLPDVELIMLGGLVRPTSASVVGHYAEQMVKEHSCRKFFLAVDGFDLTRGLTTTNTLEAHLNRMMMEAAVQTIVVMDSSKFGRLGLSRICGVEEIHRVVTDDGVSEGTVKALEDKEISVVIA